MVQTNFIFAGILVLQLWINVTSACPNIISRSEWGARPTNISPLAINPPTHVIIHHATGSSCTTKSACSKRVKSIQNTHIDNKKWSDIGYNFLVGEDGNVYEGRGWGKHGAHAPDYNSKSIGICIIGTFTSQLPNAAALNAVKSLIDCGVTEGKIKSDYKLFGHRQVKATACPGDSLYTEIKTWPHWTSSP